MNFATRTGIPSINQGLVQQVKAGGGAKPASTLDNVSTDVVSGTMLPKKKDLAYLPNQIGEGTDVFDRFEEGLDPANENPLSIENNFGTLTVDVAGSSFTDKESDSYNKTSVKPLEYSATAQRYLITNDYNVGGAASPRFEPMDQILINVDRTTKTAKVWMREMENGANGRAWSDWAEIVSYK